MIYHVFRNTAQYPIPLARCRRLVSRSWLLVGLKLYFITKCYRLVTYFKQVLRRAKMLIESPGVLNADARFDDKWRFADGWRGKMSSRFSMLTLMLRFRCSMRDDFLRWSAPFYNGAFTPQLAFFAYVASNFPPPAALSRELRASFSKRYSLQSTATSDKLQRRRAMMLTRRLMLRRDVTMTLARYRTFKMRRLGKRSNADTTHAISAASR